MFTAYQETQLRPKTIRPNHLAEKQMIRYTVKFSSVDKKLAKDKKLNTDVWYDEKTLNWVKASFEKKGKWEYRLTLID